MSIFTTMVNIQNSDAIKAIRDNARLSISEGFPQSLNNNIQAVIDMTPRNHRICNIIKSSNATNATSGTVYTTPADKDFYLVEATLSVIKDATATSVSTRISVTVDGIALILARIEGLTLTAQSETLNIVLPVPIKVDRNTAINVTNSTNVANISAGACIVGYTVEP